MARQFERDKNFRGDDKQSLDPSEEFEKLIARLRAEAEAQMPQKKLNGQPHPQGYYPGEMPRHVHEELMQGPLGPDMRATLDASEKLSGLTVRSGPATKIESDPKATKRALELLQAASKRLKIAEQGGRDDGSGTRYVKIDGRRVAVPKSNEQLAAEQDLIDAMTRMAEVNPRDPGIMQIASTLAKLKRWKSPAAATPAEPPKSLLLAPGLLKTGNSGMFGSIMDDILAKQAKAAAAAAAGEVAEPRRPGWRLNDNEEEELRALLAKEKLRREAAGEPKKYTGMFASIMNKIVDQYGPPDGHDQKEVRETQTEPTAVAVQALAAPAPAPIRGRKQLIVDGPPAVEQLSRAAFMHELQAKITAAVGRESGCLYIEAWFAKHADSDAWTVEAMAKKYSGLKSADNAMEYIPPIIVRLQRGIARWQAGQDISSELNAAGIGGGIAPMMERTSGRWGVGSVVQSTSTLSSPVDADVKNSSDGTEPELENAPALQLEPAVVGPAKTPAGSGAKSAQRTTTAAANTPLRPDIDVPLIERKFKVGAHECKATLQFTIDRSSAVAESESKTPIASTGNDIDSKTQLLNFERVLQKKSDGLIREFSVRLVKNEVGMEDVLGTLLPGVAVSLESEWGKFNLTNGKNFEVEVAVINLVVKGDVGKWAGFTDGTKIELAGEFSMTVTAADAKRLAVAARGFARLAAAEAKARVLARMEARNLTKASYLKSAIAKLERRLAGTAKAAYGEARLALTRTTKQLAALHKKSQSIAKAAKRLTKLVHSINASVEKAIGGLSGIVAKFAKSVIAKALLKAVAAVLGILNLIMFVADLIQLGKYIAALAARAATWAVGGDDDLDNATPGGKPRDVSSAPGPLRDDRSDASSTMMEGGRQIVSDQPRSEIAVGASSDGDESHGGDSDENTSRVDGDEEEFGEVSAPTPDGVDSGTQSADGTAIKRGGNAPPDAGSSKPPPGKAKPGTARPHGQPLTSAPTPAFDLQSILDERQAPGAMVMAPGDNAHSASSSAGSGTSSPLAPPASIMQPAQPSGSTGTQSSGGNSETPSISTKPAPNHGQGSFARGGGIGDAKHNAKDATEPAKPPTLIAGGAGMAPAVFDNGDIQLSAAQIPKWITLKDGEARESDAALRWIRIYGKTLCQGLEISAVTATGSVDDQGEYPTVLVLKVTKYEEGVSKDINPEFRFTFRPQAPAPQRITTPMHIDTSTLSNVLRQRAPGIFDIAADTLTNLNGLTIRVISTNTAVVGNHERMVELTVHFEVVSKNDSKLHELFGKPITVGDQHTFEAVIPKP